MRFASVVTVLALLLAGCLTTTPAPAPASEPSGDTGWAARALPNGEGHDHFERAHHRNLSTPNFEILGFDPLVTDHHGKNSGGYFCGDVETTEGRTLAVVHSFTSDVAFVLVDVTDAAAPQKVGELVMEKTHVWDVAMTPDQRHVVLATSSFGDVDEEAQGPTSAAGADGTSETAGGPAAAFFRDACTGEERAVAGLPSGFGYRTGVVLVEITDPKAPVVTDYRPLPTQGGHSIVAQQVGDRALILVTVSNLMLTNYYAFMEVVATPLGDRLETHSVYHTDKDTDRRGGIREPLFSNHDGYMALHPLTERPIAYLADGERGVLLLDITDPKVPVVLSRWNLASRIASPQGSHFAHSILPIEGLWDSRHYTFVSEECGGRQATPSCLVYVLDTTDPAAPTLAGAWTLPHDPGAWRYPGFSPHYMAIIDRTLFVAHWHAGLWALDVATPEDLRQMPAIGVFVPDQEVEFVGGGFFASFHMVPVVADVLALGDHLLVFDGTSGVYTVRFDASGPMPSPEPWPLRLP